MTDAHLGKCNNLYLISIQNLASRLYDVKKNTFTRRYRIEKENVRTFDICNIFDIICSAYPMTSHPRGKVLLINNENFGLLYKQR
jgi:hypothetical protein